MRRRIKGGFWKKSNKSLGSKKQSLTKKTDPRGGGVRCSKTCFLNFQILVRWTWNNDRSICFISTTTQLRATTNRRTKIWSKLVPSYDVVGFLPLKAHLRQNWPRSKRGSFDKSQLSNLYLILQLKCLDTWSPANEMTLFVHINQFLLYGPLNFDWNFTKN